MSAGLPSLRPGVRRFAMTLATVGWLAVGVQLVLAVQGALEAGETVSGAVIGYFSWFTILTNVGCAAALTAAATGGGGATGGFLRRPSIATALAASITMVGGVYIVLLRALYDPEGLALLTDTVFHYLMPAGFLGFWWAAVPTDHLRWPDALRWLPYPVAYLMYTLVRGAVTGYYPYPFVDVSTLGYGRVTANAVALLGLFVALGALLVVVGRARGPVGGGAAPPG